MTYSSLATEYVRHASFNAIAGQVLTLGEGDVGQLGLGPEVGPQGAGETGGPQGEEAAHAEHEGRLVLGEGRDEDRLL